MARGTNAAKRERQRSRRGRNRNAGTPMGYLELGGDPMLVQGDEQAPFFKLPPFPSDDDKLFESEALGSQAYVDTEDIDVEYARTLTLFVEFVSAAAGSILSIIPQCWNEARQSFVEVLTINPTITLLTPTGYSENFESRGLYQTELRSPAIGAGHTWQGALQFDVAPYTRYRFRVIQAAGNVAGAVRLAISTSE